jgi:nitric oxide reductase large subunit
MASADSINQFVNEALKTGRSRTEIQSALTSAGWSAREIDDALSAYADTDFTPPVPRPRNQLTARDAFIYLLLFTSLGFAASFLVSLLQAIVDTLMYEAGENASDSADQIRFAIAVLVVSGPLYIWMTILTRRQIAGDAGRERSLVRKWLTYLSLFVTALFFLGDAIFVVYNFLDGDITLRFFMKALIVAVVSGAIFLFYLRDVEEMKRDG